MRTESRFTVEDISLSQSTFHLSDEEDFADCRAEVEVLRGRASELEDRLAYSLQEGRDATTLAAQLKELNLELEGDLQEKENETGELSRALNDARVEFTQKLHNLREFYEKQGSSSTQRFKKLYEVQKEKVESLEVELDAAYASREELEELFATTLSRAGQPIDADGHDRRPCPKCVDLEREIADLRLSYSAESESRNSDFNSEVEKWSKVVGELREQNGDLVRKISAEEDKHDAATRDLADNITLLQNRLAERITEADIDSETMCALHARIADLEQELAVEQTNVEELQDKLQASEEARTESERRDANLICPRCPELEEELGRKQQDVKALEFECEKNAADKRILRGKIEDRDEELAKLLRKLNRFKQDADDESQSVCSRASRDSHKNHRRSRSLSSDKNDKMY